MMDIELMQMQQEEERELEQVYSSSDLRHTLI